MCGIAGIVKWGNVPISEEQIRMLLVGNEHRGNDASGIAVQQQDGSIAILKRDVPGWKLTASNEYEKFIKDRLHPNSRCVLVHARGASQGNPRDNNNNHPMYAGCSAVVHNGVIRNDEFLFEEHHLERKAATDSDVLRAMIDKWGLTDAAIQHIDKAHGSGAIAAIHPNFKDKLLLIRSGNPLTLASNDDFFFFSSEKTTLHNACRPFVERMGMWFQAQRVNVDFSNMVDNTAWIIGPKGLEKHLPCRICQGNYSEPWRRTYEEYSQRQEKWNERARTATTVEHVKALKTAYCPDCQKEWMIPGNGIYSQYTCNSAKGGCGKTLWRPPDAPIVSTSYGKVN